MESMIKRMEPLPIYYSVDLDGEPMLTEESNLPIPNVSLRIGEAYICSELTSFSWATAAKDICGKYEMCPWELIDDSDDYYRNSVRISYFGNLVYIEARSEHKDYRIYTATIVDFFESWSQLARRLVPLIRMQPIYNEMGELELSTNLNEAGCTAPKYNDFEAFHNLVTTLNNDLKKFVEDNLGTPQDFIAHKGFKIGKPTALFAEAYKESDTYKRFLKEENRRLKILKLKGCEAFEKILNYTNRRGTFPDNATVRWEGTRLIEFQYTGPFNKKTYRKVNLERILDFKGCLYLVGICQLRQASRTFRLDRSNLSEQNLIQLGFQLKDTPPTSKEQAQKYKITGDF